MVDPNRKINRLNDRDIEFFEECESEFSNRYTDNDSEFTEHCSKPEPDPPLLDNWNAGGAGAANDDQPSTSGYNNRFNQSSSSGGQRNYRNNDNRGFYNRDNSGWRGNNKRHYDDRNDQRYRPHRNYHPYNSSNKWQRGGGGGGYGYGSEQNHHQQYQRQRPDHSSSKPPIEIRRDYSNFVPASKD